jgi:hypothetical protein
LPLPFLATHVELDAIARELDPAVDIAVFEVPAESGPRHRVALVALDGTKVQGTVREQDGIAQPDGDGYTIILEPASTTRAPPAAAPRPIGTKHNGFTKLR